jgi:energy-coupling factor transport system substrate-specific component
VSWSAAALLILGLALAGGFAWYERSRPDARVLALVACLAALAALGRIAFAAVPNVKPTTDIVLVAGFALGAGPGFAVGALAGLSSNFFFGQGPWTPWQMAAWGAAGVIGAGLGRLCARRSAPAPAHIGRLSLATACAVTGFGFTVVQDVGDWVTYSDHSLAQLGAYVGQGLGFDAIHAAGCVAFALLIGPALIRSVQRFARRLEVHWVPVDTAFPPLLLAVAIGLGIAAGAGSSRAATAPAGPVRYLLRAQGGDGGFGGAPGQPSSGLFTGWAALGLAATGRSPLGVVRAGHSVIGYLRSTSGGSLDTGSLERTMLVLRAAGLSARAFDGRDMVGELSARRRRNGSFGGQANLTAFAVLALRSAGVRPGSATLRWLARQQNQDGGFSFASRGGQSDVDDSGSVLEALAGTPELAAVRARAVSYLRTQQDRDGGLPSEPGGGSNAQSTAWAIQGLEAAGVDPAGLRRHGARSPVSYLRSLVTANGSVQYARGQRQTPVWVTGEALMALAGKPLPLVPLPKPAPVKAVTAGTSAAHAAPAATSLRPVKARGHRARSARKRRARLRATAPVAQPSLMGLAAGAGALAALILAPVDLG